MGGASQSRHVAPCEDAGTVRKSLDALFASYLSWKVFNGASVGLIIDGKPYYYSAGSTALVGGSKPDPDTVYEIGSVTKTFLAVVVAQLLLDNKLALNDPVQQHLLRYLAANLGVHKTVIDKAIARTHTTLFDARGKAATPATLLDGVSQPHVDEVGMMWLKKELTAPKLMTTGHIGAMGGFMTVISFNRARKTGFVLLLNSRNWAPEVLGDAIWRIVLAPSS